MCIAYLVSQYPAASHTFIRREIDALRRRGLDVKTFSIRPPGPHERAHPRDEEAFRSTWYLLPPRLFEVLVCHALGFLRRPRRYVTTLFAALRHRVPGARAFFYGLLYFGEAIVLARELERVKARHLHNHFANPAANVGFLASRFLELGWSVTLHGLSDFDYPSRLLLPEKARVARFIACVSHFGRAQGYRLVAPKFWPKLVLVRCGLDLSLFPEQKVRDASRPVRVITVGRLAPEKGQLGLIDAFSEVVQGGSSAELHIVGDGPLRNELEQRIADRGLVGRCVLRGYKPEREVLDEIAQADVFVLSSFMEGLPVVLMEALALGLGVVAPCVAGIPELVEHEHSGLLFPAGDWQSLARNLARLIGDEELRRRLGAAGRSRVELEFDVERTVEPLVERYRELDA
jgi:colanic acid/amylovoran biosynthesis glycosyltransferase